MAVSQARHLSKAEDRSAGRSIQHRGMLSQREHENLVDRARKMADNAVDKSMFQAAGGPVVFAQLDGDEHEDALNKSLLPGLPDMPDGLVGVALTLQIVRFTPAARLDGPEIDPGDDRWIIGLTSEGAKSWEIVKAIDDEDGGSLSGHG
jgi:hypothetical protein